MTGSLREAMMYGVPVATTPVSGNPEVVDGRHTGLLITDDEKRTAEMIVRSVFKPKLLRKLSCNAKCLAERIFSIERHGERLERAYLRGAK